MRIGVLGTGQAGMTIGTKLVEIGHEVRMGSRTTGNEKATAWAAATGERASEGDFAAAAEFAEVVFNCTFGAASVDALQAAGATNLKGKLLVEVGNPLDFSHGMPPRLTVCNTDSLAEQIQRAFPDARVVKALNTVNAEVMVEPSIVPGDHVLPICGNDLNAKKETTALLGEMGWPATSVIDIGDLKGARAMEMYLPLWVHFYGALGTPHFNIILTKEN